MLCMQTPFVRNDPQSHATLLRIDPLPIHIVRRIASMNGAREICFNEVSRVVSFQCHDTRVNVYYSTGTVGTSLDHPRQGRTQLFRRNVSLEMLSRIFANPRIHTGHGYHRLPGPRSNKKRKLDTTRIGIVTGADDEAAVDEECALKAQLAAIDDEARALQAERVDVKAALLDMGRRREAEEKAKQDMAYQAYYRRQQEQQQLRQQQHH
jgi:hypothetical protein